MKQIQAKFNLKDKNIEEPKNYLGTELSKMINEEGDELWAMLSKKCFTAAVANMEVVLKNKRLRLPEKCTTPL